MHTQYEYTSMISENCLKNSTLHTTENTLPAVFRSRFKYDGGA